LIAEHPHHRQDRDDPECAMGQMYPSGTTAMDTGISRVGIVGAGTMGNGIAQLYAVPGLRS
jgi:hypothetical protein